LSGRCGFGAADGVLAAGASSGLAEWRGGKNRQRQRPIQVFFAALRMTRFVEGPNGKRSVVGEDGFASGGGEGVDGAVGG
jgi:hypothetical protein